MTSKGFAGIDEIITIHIDKESRLCSGALSKFYKECWNSEALIFLSFVGIWKESLVLRLGYEKASQAVKLPGVKHFNVTGKSMKGWVMINENDVEDDVGLKKWLRLALDFVTTLPAKS